MKYFGLKTNVGVNMVLPESALGLRARAVDDTRGVLAWEIGVDHDGWEIEELVELDGYAAALDWLDQNPETPLDKMAK